MKLKTLIPSTFNPNQWINLFNVYKDSDGAHFFNLLNTVQIPDDAINPVYFDEYFVTETDNLFHISHKFYGVVHLWWLIGYINKIVDPFYIEGKKIKVLKPDIVGQILEFVLAAK
jgi:hypothetical protein